MNEVHGHMEVVPGVFVKSPLQQKPVVEIRHKNARPSDWHAEGVDPYEDGKELYERS